MAHTRSAKKRIRQAEKRRLLNRYHISRMKTAIKRINEALKNKDIETAEKLLPLAQKLAYRAAAKGAIHKNEAARRVSRIARKVNAAKQALSS
ncbi:30S ribosomal protein S20 [Persephonella atlantica]|uniref:Small ribosomal subunit protein bS20 n=1 Tax=Persephonella atlantica TaxID=2699429 RepID=A0ABS1GGF6_9AQUI|nr:30S ribosomal protein S20 [Persephonella atlantica]MBK3332002.1 30S ribosomal protein S20 [Persephonella atlantica]